MQLDNYERLRLQDGLQEEKFKCGDYIIREGEEGHKFYMVEEGELIATKYDQDSNE